MDAGPIRVETQSSRLPAGGLIDRSRALKFSFDGRALTGHPGDTLASALLGNGVRLVGRSFKYHRPRGILATGVEEPNALMEVGYGARRRPNTRATIAELYDGLTAVSQNRFPSLTWDLLSANQWFSRFFAAGFYYKTFMWPRSFWEPVYERVIRRAAGLGRASLAPDPDRYEAAHAHCDVLVIGAGPAGLTAARTAARAGARVILADEDFLLGGRLLCDRRTIDGQPGAEWAAEVTAELSAMPDVRILTRTSVFGVYDGGTYGLLERVADHLPSPPAHLPRLRSWRVVARRCVLTAGAIERPLVFGGNDRPGVMLAGAARAYANRFAVSLGRSAVVFASHDDAAATAHDLGASGVSVIAIVDPRPESSDAMRAAAEATGAQLYAGAVVETVFGSRAVRGVSVRGPNGTERLDCDLVAMSGGWNPSVQLTTHLGGRPVWNDRLAAFVPGSLPPGLTVAGAAGGRLTLADALADGVREGAFAAEAIGLSPRRDNGPAAEPEPCDGTPLWRVRGGRGKAFVDFQNDVSDHDIDQAHQEGFRRVEHLKRYTTLGMATDEGKTSNVNGLAMMAELTQISIPRAGTTTSRPPFAPIELGALAGHAVGRNLKPTRLTPTHGWAHERGAVFVEAGLWLRAAYFPHAGEDWLASASREARAVRDSVGFCDVSTLGKIDVQGTDAATFLDRVYTGVISTLPIGRVRYGVMLREDGFVFDDGTVARIGPAQYVLTTTTAQAVRVMAHLELCRQWLFPGLDVALTSVTEQWAQLAIAGPRSRDILNQIVDDGDISDAALPYMGCMRLSVMGGIKARLFRISFSGERAYELAVPSRHGEALAARIAALGAVPYGLEALNILRVEKGHPAGAELNGQTTAHDLGLAKLLSTRKDFVGRAMATRSALTDVARETLVGLRPVDRTARVDAGAHILAQSAPADGAHDQGHVTSAVFSPVLGQWVGLALVRNGPARIGETVRIADPLRGRETLAELTSPCFVDAAHERLRG